MSKTVQESINEKYEELKKKLEIYNNYDIKTIYSYLKMYYFHLSENNLKSEILKNTDNYKNEYSKEDKIIISDLVFEFICFLKTFS
jgi:hypothetical protein